jgi:hypothetical protein
MNADFRVNAAAAPLPRNEDDVNQFIFARTQQWRDNALVEPLTIAIALIDKGKR